MIRLRTADGVPLPLPPNATFVELVSPFDQSVQLVLVQLSPGEILELRPGSDGARRYEAMLNGQVKFTGREIRRAAP